MPGGAAALVVDNHSYDDGDGDGDGDGHDNGEKKESGDIAIGN